MEVSSAECPNSIGCYDLSYEQMVRAGKLLLQERPLNTKSPIVCYEVGGNTPEADIARTVEAKVFYRAFGEDAEKMAELYGAYEHTSHFFLSIVGKTGQPVGALRVIRNSEQGLMTLNNLMDNETLPDDVRVDDLSELMQAFDIESLDDCWDIGTVAVVPEYRKQGKTASVQLYRAMYKSARQQKIEHLVSIIDTRVLAVMRNYLGIPFEDMTPPFAFEGAEENIAVHGRVKNFFRIMAQKSLSARGIAAANKLWPLVFGTKDSAIDLLSRYQK